MVAQVIQRPLMQTIRHSVPLNSRWREERRIVKPPSRQRLSNWRLRTPPLQSADVCFDMPAGRRLLMMIQTMPAPDLIRVGNRLSGKIMPKQKARAG
jgi:hypothetical protein